MSAQTIAVIDQPFDVTEFTDRYVRGTPLTNYQAQALTRGILDTLATAQELLRVAFTGKAHEVLGYGRGLAGWDAYFADNFADVVTALPQAQRRLEVAKWNEVGASLSVVATATGTSKATISEDRKHVGQVGNVESLDGRRRNSAAVSAAVTQAKAASATKPVALTQRIEDMVRAAGSAGLTQKESMKKLKGLHHGQVSAAFTALKQQRRTHLTGERRDGYGVHVTAEHLVIDAEIVD